MGLFDRIKEALSRSEEDLAPGQVRLIGYTGRGKHYEQYPPSNVQSEQELENGDVIWLNEEDEC